MLRDLDDSLRALLEQELPRGVNRFNMLGVTFAAPDQDFPGNLKIKPPLIDFFLYDVRENRDLRSNEWTVTKKQNSADKRRPPVRVDCSYLVTAWGSSKDLDDRAREEHWILGHVAAVLLKYPTLPADVLYGQLRKQEPPLPAVALGQGHLQSPSDFWHAMGGKPRAALHYRVTIGLEPWDAVDLGKPVGEIELRFHQLPEATPPDSPILTTDTDRDARLTARPPEAEPNATSDPQPRR